MFRLLLVGKRLIRILQAVCIFRLQAIRFPGIQFMHVKGNKLDRSRCLLWWKISHSMSGFLHQMIRSVASKMGKPGVGFVDTASVLEQSVC